MLALSARLGAELVPQLDEGDRLIEARRLPGIALTDSVATKGRLQKGLRHLLEVEHVVSRTGAPELATDPMGMEQSDAYITLKDRENWRPVLAKEALAKRLPRSLKPPTLTSSAPRSLR